MRNAPFYQQWMQEQGIPVHQGFGIDDVRTLKRDTWTRAGTDAALIHLSGMEGFTGAQLVEIQPEASLAPQRHLFDSSFLVLEGEGLLEVWPDAESQESRRLKWAKHSLFAIPMNCGYRLHNTGSAPALCLAVNNAPVVLDTFRDEGFVFSADHAFRERFPAGTSDLAALLRKEDGNGITLTGIGIDSVSRMITDPHGGKGEGVDLTTVELAGSAIASHVAEWPAGSYHLAHHHQGGAVLFILAGQGYTLMWPQQAGQRPYEAGNADQVVRVNWNEGSIFSPPTGWYHQHFNTGSGRARQLAFRGSSLHPSMIQRALNPMVGDRSAAYVSTREGGNLIDSESEDPQIRRDYEQALSEAGS